MSLKIRINFPLDTLIQHEDFLDFAITNECLETVFDLFFPMAIDVYNKADPMIKMVGKQFARNAIYKLGPQLPETIAKDLLPPQGQDPIIHLMGFIRKYIGMASDGKTINLSDNGNGKITSFSIT